MKINKMSHAPMLKEVDYYTILVFVLKSKPNFYLFKAAQKFSIPG